MEVSWLRKASENWPFLTRTRTFKPCKNLDSIEKKSVKSSTGFELRTFPVQNGCVAAGLAPHLHTFSYVSSFMISLPNLCRDRKLRQLRSFLSRSPSTSSSSTASTISSATEEKSKTPSSEKSTPKKKGAQISPNNLPKITLPLSRQPRLFDDNMVR